MNQLESMRVSITERLSGLICSQQGEEMILGYTAILSEIANLKRPLGSSEPSLLKKVEGFEKQLVRLKDEILRKLYHILEVPVGSPPDCASVGQEYSVEDFQKKLRNVCPMEWSAIHGLKEVKAKIQSNIVLPMKKPELFSCSNTPAKTFLFYGPKGCGKSVCAEGVCLLVDCAIISLNATSFLGEGSCYVECLYDYACSRDPSFIIIEDLDQLQCLCEDVDLSFKKAFFLLLDKIVNGKASIRFIAISNKPWVLPKQFVEKIEKKLYFPLPSPNEVKELLFSGFSKVSLDCSVSLSSVATSLNGSSVNGVRDFCRDVVIASLERSMMDGDSVLDSSSSPTVSQGDVDSVLTQQQKLLSESDGKKFEEWHRA